MSDILKFLKAAVESGASDLHLKAGSTGFVRVDGDLHRIQGADPLTPAQVEAFAFAMMDERAKESFATTNEADFAYSVSGLGRFRVNAFRQRGSVGLVLRRILPGTPDFETLGLPPAVRRLAEEQRGLVLVTGPTGSGKTTTTAAMISHINATRQCHVVTIEDPIEVMHKDKKAIIDQREIGVDTHDFAVALKAVTRQDPDVIFIGEMRDIETVTAAIQASETGHLVISTLHTTDAVETVNRIIDMYPKNMQRQARISLANSLRGVVSQRLVPRATGDGRLALVEILVNTSRIFEFILDPEQTDHVRDAIMEGEYYGMQTFDQHLLEMFKDGDVSLRDAMNVASNPHDFKVALRAAGLAS